MLRHHWKADKNLCVGIDPDEALPPGTKVSELTKLILGSLCNVVTSTMDLVCAYKINPAFFDRHGQKGRHALRELIMYIKNVAPDIPIILDGKYGDIGNTNQQHASTAFDDLGADAVTVIPYVGEDAHFPFLRRSEKGVIVVCRTSNPGAHEFQDLSALPTHPSKKPPGLSAEQWLKWLCEESMPLHEHIAVAVAGKWNLRKNCLLVVGATVPKEAARIRARVGDIPFLIPGIGPQGGDLKAIIEASNTKTGAKLIISSSRGILHSGNPRRAAEELHGRIAQILIRATAMT